ncbi:response regulator [Roseomonas sp. SSH11]|uniref:histidine kinase n=1 Tax=Pararoseomonas baculiformis TaxID=2820812 RepID=A0ABS4AK23_9PROT|nr:histidine kinase dimerization/phosphoacceptor domain -containing protein [Pararoseomonas baculiformis]MBP0447382.1 response regulator [Pararoseomonas baculiformis]
MRILITDDDPDFRDLALREVRREFPDAVIAEIGTPAALEAALRQEPRPGLLVSDLDLKWTDGFEVLAAVRAVNPICPAVMFTGTGNEELAVRAIKAGFDDYLVKSPKQLRRLAAAARAAVTRAETRRSLEESRDLLTQELYHRLHNNLQLVIGLISFTARSLADRGARSQLEDLARRVQSLSMLQEQLYRDGAFEKVRIGDFLRGLVDDILALDGRPIRASLDLADEVLPVDTAVPLGLIANEFLTNAIKYAFPDGAAGWISVSLRRLDQGGVILEVNDDGVGLPEAVSDAPGLGIRLVRRLAQQLGAELRISPRDGGGTQCMVRVLRPAA